MAEGSWRRARRKSYGRTLIHIIGKEKPQPRRTCPRRQHSPCGFTREAIARRQIRTPGHVFRHRGFGCQLNFRAVVPTATSGSATAARDRTEQLRPDPVTPHTEIRRNPFMRTSKAIGMTVAVTLMAGSLVAFAETNGAASSGGQARTTVVDAKGNLRVPEN